MIQLFTKLRFVNQKAMLGFLVMACLFISGFSQPAFTGFPVGPNSTFNKYPGIAIIAGNPAIAYTDHGGLYYTRSTSIDGIPMTSWPSPQLVISGTLGGKPTQIMEVGGNPAILYMNSSGALLYIRAKDPLGATWATPQTVANLGTTNLGYSMAMINGHPAVAYCDPATRDLHYKRAIDPEGNSWPESPKLLDSPGQTGHYPSLTEVNGRPAILYSRNDAGPGLGYVNAALKYLRADDAVGDSWANPPSTWNVNSAGGNHLKVIHGRPAIALTEQNWGTGVNTMKYMQASDPDGKTWPGLTTPLPGTNASLYGLLEVSGKPAFWCGASSLWYYVEAIDANATAWNAPEPTGVTNVMNVSFLVVNNHVAFSARNQAYGPEFYRRTVLSASVNSLEFDGVDDKVLFPYTVNKTMTNFTLEAWVYWTGGKLTLAGKETLFGFYIDNTGRLSYANGNNTGCTWQGGGADSKAGIVPLNQWTHVAFRSNGWDGVDFFVNGDFIENVPGLKAIPQRTSPCQGELEISAAGSKQNKISELRFWSKGRSNTEIKNDMNACLSGSESELVFYCKFNGIKGNGDVSATLENRSMTGRLSNADANAAWIDCSPNVCGCK